MNREVPLTSIFNSISPAEFFYRNRHMAGFGNTTLAVYSTVRELVENSLDACEDSGRLPFVVVDLVDEPPDSVAVTVADNGTGVPYPNVTEAFGRMLYGSKYEARQRRGTFGLGATMAVLYGQITTEHPVQIHTQTGESGGRAYRLLIDIQRNEPIVESEQALDRDGPGATVTIHIKGELKRALDRILEYLRMTTISSPHAKIVLRINHVPQAEMGRWTDQLPGPTMISKPHPRAADLEMLRRLIVSNETEGTRDFLTSCFQQIGDRTAARLLKHAALDGRKRVGSLGREEVARLSTALRSFDGFARPESACLSPLESVSFLKSVKSVFDVSFCSYSRRGPSEWEGNPFIVEGVLAVSHQFPESDVPMLYRFANKVPLLYDASEDVFTKILRKIDWSRYYARDLQQVSIFVHLCSTRIPYRAAGKQSIAVVPEIEAEALSLLKDLARDLGRSTRELGHPVRDTKRMHEFAKSFRLVAKFGASLAGTDVPSTDRLVAGLFEVKEDV